MAAYAALVSLMHIIHDIQHHHSPPITIHKLQAQSLTQIIASLQEFLEAHSSETDESDPLERRIADAAYSAEDIIESHIINRIVPTGSQHPVCKIIGSFNSFDVPLHPDNLYEHLQRVIEEMESIKKLTGWINAEKTDQRLRSNDASRTLTTRQNSITVSVCSEDVINEVMNKLTWGEPDRRVIPVVGMGGIGKTTLAKNVYEHPFIKHHFKIHAWATISQQYNAKEILSQVLSQATNKEREEVSEDKLGKSEDELGTELYRYLFGERYLIVLDDMWSTDAWDRVRHFFPDNKNSSRVLVTTRLSQLSSQLNGNYSHHMKFLDKASSWDLFSKTVFGDLISCPLELEGIGKKIVENCRGLPLSIVVVGGILRRMDRTRESWESIGKNLSSLVNLENDKHCLRLLGMSYNQLPAYLKPCFLYMGVFEEDSEIKVSTLIKLWVCEGFLKPTKDDSLETIAKRFLNELVDRNLILVHKLGTTGNIKFCKVHDLLRDFCLNENKKVGFYHVIGQSSRQGQRRVVVPRSISREQVGDNLRNISHVRSIISEHWAVHSYKNFRFARAVHAYKFYDFDEEIDVNPRSFQHVNLRHLAAIHGSMSSFFSSINLYWNLQTLIVLCKYEFTLPSEIWRMPRFKHIEFVGDHLISVFLPTPPSDAAVMENLRVLKNVEDFKIGEDVVERIPSIKKLRVWYCGNKVIGHQDYYCLGNIEHLRQLESLKVSLWIGSTRVVSLDNLTFPRSLKKLALSVCSTVFEQSNILERIGSLPLLEKLVLRGGCLGTDKWDVLEGQFPSLKYLDLSSYDLKHWSTEESSIFPRLEQLRIHGLENLEKIPSPVGDIATLQKIWLNKCSASVVKSAKAIVEEQMELQGEQLMFDVVVRLAGRNEKLESLAGPNFQVSASLN